MTRRAILTDAQVREIRAYPRPAPQAWIKFTARRMGVSPHTVQEIRYKGARCGEPKKRDPKPKVTSLRAKALALSEQGFLPDQIARQLKVRRTQVRVALRAFGIVNARDDIWNRPAEHEALLLKLKAHHPNGGERVVLRPGRPLALRFGESIAPVERAR